MHGHCCVIIRARPAGALPLRALSLCAKVSAKGPRRFDSPFLRARIPRGSPLFVHCHAVPGGAVMGMCVLSWLAREVCCDTIILGIKNEVCLLGESFRRLFG